MTVLRLRVTQPDGVVSVTEFGPEGGTLGRSPDATLMLEDQARTIGRQQAAIRQEGGAYVFHQMGANPSKINGVFLAASASRAMANGDLIEIGKYKLKVELADAASLVGATPGAGVLPGFTTTITSAYTPTVMSPPRSAPVPAQAPAPQSSTAVQFSDPFSDLFGSGAAAQPPGQPLASMGNDVGGIPADFDPFASAAIRTPQTVRPSASSSQPANSGSRDPFTDPFLGTAPASRSTMAHPMAEPAAAVGQATYADPFAPAAAIAGLGIADAMGNQNNSIDALFGLGASSSDPMAALDSVSPASPFGAFAPSSDNSLDPLAMFGGAAPAPSGVGPAASNHTPEIYAAFVDRKAVEPSVVSLGDQRKMDAVLASVAPQSKPAEAAQRAVQISAPIGGGGSPPTTPPAPPSQLYGAPPAKPASAPVQAVSAGLADQAALIAAMVEGLGVDVNLDDGLTEEFMYRVGSLVRESVQGCIELLQARAASKREVKANSTVIMERNNNPLKFSPNSNIAMLYLLSGKLNPAFMPPMLAMRDAINDLKSHQVGVMAGTRAALEGVIERFEPEHLEKRLSSKGMIDSLIPAARKAKLWDLYIQMYGDIAREASDDFQALFGNAFVVAYEEQTDMLKGNLQ